MMIVEQHKFENVVERLLMMQNVLILSLQMIKEDKYLSIWLARHFVAGK